MLNKKNGDTKTQTNKDKQNEKEEINKKAFSNVCIHVHTCINHCLKPAFFAYNLGNHLRKIKMYCNFIFTRLIQNLPHDDVHT